MSQKLTGKRMIDLAITVFCAAVAALYFYTAYAGQLPLFQQRGIIMAAAFIVLFVKHPMFKGKRAWWTMAIDVVLVLATLVAVYQMIKLEAEALPFTYHRPTNYEIAMAVGLTVAVLEATRRAIGWPLPILAIISILYALFGNNLPGIFRHTYIDFSLVFYYLGIATDGIWGLPLYVTSTVVIVFMIFASLLQECGLLKFFVDLANGLVGKYRGGPAKVAVVGSSVVATVSGSAVANVAAVGSFSIPMMKKTGYSANFAGAIEACASTGGVITPPVMGATAFIIAEYLGVSYWAVCIASIVPAALYYYSLFVGVDLEAMKAGIKGMPREQLPSARKVMFASGYMVIPLVVLIYFLGVVRSSAMLASFWAIISILALAMIKKETRKPILGWGLVKGFANGMKDMVGLVATCACAGIVVGVLHVTGLGFRLSFVLITLTGGSLLALLVLCAIVCIVLGMGMTTTSVYLLMAMVVAPAIVQSGVLPMAAHLFVFFLGNLSHITPPVAVAVFAACAISGGDIFATAWQSCRLGAILFLLPFFFVYNPALIVQGAPVDIIVSITTAIVGVTTLSFAISNYSWFGKINLLQRVLYGVGGIALAYPSLVSSAIGAAMIVPPILYSIFQRGKPKKPVAV